MTSRRTPPRRRVLAVAAGAAATAGCLGGRSGPTRRRMGESEPAGPLVVSAPRLSRTVVWHSGAGERVLGRQAGQFLVVDIATDGYGPKTTFLDATVDGERLDTGAVALRGDPVHANGRVGLLVPVGPADRASVVLDRRGRRPTHWRVPDRVVDRFDAAPAFGVESVDLTDSDVAVAVANTGDRDGTFRATVAVGDAGPRTVLRADVPVGATRAATAPIPDRADDGDVLTVDWGLGATERPLPDG